MLKIFNDAIDFFSLLFSDFHQWLSEDSNYERGAWVRVYGIPLHAWNISFFKLCTSGCGRFVRADDCTLDKGRIDYARILLSTKSLEVLNENVELFVDGRKCFIKIVEEWGCNLGEDAFLTEEVSVTPEDNVNEEHENVNGRDIDVLDGDVDNLIEDIHREWKEHEEKLASEAKNNDGSVGGKDIMEMALSAAACKDSPLPNYIAETAIVSVPSFKTGATLLQQDTTTIFNNSDSFKDVSKVALKKKKETSRSL
jgi:hypothetical protein